MTATVVKARALNILGIGNDLCDVARMAGLIQRYGPRLLDQTFTRAEQDLARRQPDQPLFYAWRFAAKEAFVKALGTGIAERMSWTDVEVLASPEGLPVATISGEALVQLKHLAEREGDATVHLSITHDARFAAAFVILEACRPPGRAP